jgi:very-short-patch-repair endonuclease
MMAFLQGTCSSPSTCTQRQFSRKVIINNNNNNNNNGKASKRQKRGRLNSFIQTSAAAKKKDENGDDEVPDPNAWMANARKDTERRAMQFRKARPDQDVSDKSKREPRRYSRAGRDLDKIRTALSRGWILDEESGEYVKPESSVGDFETTSSVSEAGVTSVDILGGIWQPDLVSSKEWKDQWTMTQDEWKAIQAECKQAVFPVDCLKIFESGGLRRISPNIAGKMLEILGKKYQSSGMDRFERAGIRRDPRFAHLVGLAVATARQNSDEFNISSICSAIWGLAVISGEAANAAEMEVLSNRATRSVMEMSASNVANVAWALASVRHSNEGLWLAFNEYAEQKGFKGIDVFKLTALCWATSHLQMSGEGIVKGISKWMSYVPETTTSAEKEYGMKYQTGKVGVKQLCTLSWSLATLRDDVGLNSELFKSVWGHICSEDGVKKFLEDDEVRGRDLNQLYQTALAISSSKNTTGLPSLPDLLMEKCANAWTEQRRPPVISWFQRDVSAILSYMGERYEEEAIVAGYRVDVLLESIGVVLEVDGPSHFSRNVKNHALGQTMLKRSLLSSAGYKVFPIAVTEWDMLFNVEEKSDYIRSALDALANGEEIPEIKPTEDFFVQREDKNEGDNRGGTGWNRRPTSTMGSPSSKK